MNWLNFDLRKGFLIALVVLIPLISINTQQSPRATGWYNKPFSWIAEKIQTSLFAFSESIHGTTRLYLNLVNIKRENAELKKENDQFKIQLQLFEELKKENLRMSLLLDFKEKTKMEMIAARIMSRDLLDDHATIQIDKGLDHGLKAGQAVIALGGALGHVFRPQAKTSLVLLLTDRFSVIDGVIGRSRARGIVEGKNLNGCALKYVEKSEDVKAGDLVLTSGLDNIFPKGFPIAIVENVENKSFQASLRVDLKPVADPDKVEEVFIITNAKQVDLTISSNPVAPIAPSPNESEKNQSL